MSGLKPKVILAAMLALSAPTMAECTATVACPTCTVVTGTSV